MNIINIPIKDNEYNVYISNNLLSHLEDYIDVSRETVIITDTNIPPVYLEKIKPKFNDLFIKYRNHSNCYFKINCPNFKYFQYEKNGL